MGDFVDMSDVDITTGDSVLSEGFCELTAPETAPEVPPGAEMDQQIQVITPGIVRALAPKGDGKDGQREAAWKALPS